MVRIVALGFACLLVAGSASAQGLEGTWDMVGTERLKFPGAPAVTLPSVATLVLNPDRTFSADFVDGLVVNTGAWFHDGKRIMIVLDNFLEQVLALEADVEAGLGEEAIVIPLATKDKNKVKSETEISFVTKTRWKVVLPESNDSVVFSVKGKWTATRQP